MALEELGGLHIRWVGCVKQDFRNLQIRNWKKNVLKRDSWRGIFEAVMAAAGFRTIHNDEVHVVWKFYKKILHMH
jgi:hypothetical protein